MTPMTEILVMGAPFLLLIVLMWWLERGRND